MKQKIDKEEVEEKKRLDMKSTNTAFILMFPALILAAMAIYFAHSIFLSVVTIALAIYQFLMLKKFVEDFYKR